MRGFVGVVFSRVGRAVQAAAEEVLERLRHNILTCRHGNGRPYPLTRDGRIPFLSVMDDWHVGRTRTGYAIRADKWWWRVHLDGAKIRPHNARGVLMIPTSPGRVIFVKGSVTIPKRNFVPTSAQVKAIVNRHIRQELNRGS